MPTVARSSTTETSVINPEDNHPPPLWPAWITTTAAALSIDPALIYGIWLDGRRDGWQLGYVARDAQLSEGAFEDARKVAGWVARDLRRKPANDLDLEAYRLWQRVHPELAGSPS